MMLDMTWELEPGAVVLRKDLHDRYGGGRQQGISYSAQSPNVFVFSDAASGEQHGYFDRWTTDGVYLYTGDGKRGDQTFIRGNKALLNHRADSRQVRLFRGAGGPVEYLGEYEVDPEKPYFIDDAPESGSPAIRKVIIFRLRPVDPATLQSGTVMVPTQPTVTSVSVQETHTESWQVSPNPDPTTAQAHEQQLVLEFKNYLEQRGCTVTRHRYQTGTQASPLYSDLYNETRQQMIEAKGSVSRSDIRMAIGQLFDYQHLEEGDPDLGLLLPEVPRPDLADLLHQLEITVIVPVGDGFADTAGGLFV
jgi:hypothetical protein